MTKSFQQAAIRDIAAAFNIPIEPQGATQGGLDRALALADLGLKAFPCRPDNKSPLIAGGFLSASSDPDAIRAWWKRSPDALVGLPTGKENGIAVVDLDKKGEKDWTISVRKAGIILPDTHIVTTRSGGEHRYYRYPADVEKIASKKDLFGNLVGNKETGIDTRGDGGYVIAWSDLNEQILGDLTPWPTGVFADDRDDWVHVGMALKAEFGESGRDAWDEWSKTSEKYDAKDQDHKWRSFNGSDIQLGTLFHLAKQHGWEPPASVAFSLGGATQEPPLKPGEQGTTQPPKPESNEHLLRYSFYSPKPEKEIAPKQFLCRNSRHHVRKFTSGTVSPGGVGKTYLIFGETLAYLTGKALLGLEPVEPVNVCIWCEDPMEELEARFAAAMKLHKLTEYDLKARPVLISARKDEMIIARELRGQTLIIKPVIENVIQQMKAFNIGIKYIDPFVKTHALKENDNVAMDIAAKQWNLVAEETGAAIDLIMHTRKLGGSDEVTVEDGRGAGSVIYNARSVRALNRMSEKEALALGVEHEHWRHFRVGIGKTNVGPMSDKSEWYKIESISLENGDNLGAVKSWKPPSPHKDVSYDQIREVQHAVAQGTYWESVQAKQWVGHPIAEVLGMDLAEPAQMAKMKAMVKGWIKGGVLKKENRLDEKRREMRPAITAGEPFNERS